MFHSSGRRMEIKAAKTIFLIIAAFIVCNTPVFAVTWYDHGNEEQQLSNSRHNNNNDDRSKRLFLLSVAMWQVCIDPVIYIVRLKDFKRIRRALVELLLLALKKVFRT